jgi:hypothetical protein
MTAWEKIGRTHLGLEGWRWMPGMLTLTGHRIREVEPWTGVLYVACISGESSTLFGDESAPDLRDESTRALCWYVCGPASKEVKP